MQTKPRAIVTVIFSTLITATGQFFFKMGAERLPSDLFDIKAYMPNWPLALGIILYAIAFGLLILALRDGELSVLYPFISLGFVWVALVSFLILKEPFSFAKLGGIALIMFGVSFVGWGSKESAQAS